MWWMPNDPFDNDYSFDRYGQIGGWKQPTMKILGQPKYVCSAAYFDNYYL